MAKNRSCWKVCAGAVLLMAILVAGPESGAQTFTKVTTGALVTDLAAARSAHWIDYDKDGDLDLFVTRGKAGGQNNILYRNDGPPDYTFTPMTGLVVSQDGQPSDGATWGDYDNDGYDDLFVVNWYGMNNMLYHNNGDGTFTRILAGAPVTDGGYSETASWGDYNNDGWLDLAVSNSAGDLHEFLYKNHGDGTFEKITTGPIPAGVGESRGLTWVDYDNDHDLDLFVVNESNQNEYLYKNLLTETGVDSFESVTTGALVNSGGSTWSGSWGDFDNDGDLDLFVANHANQNNNLFVNLGDGTFQKMPLEFGDVVDDSGYSASSSWVDADNDGDLDLYVSNAYGGNGTNFYYRNLLTETGVATFERVLIGTFVNPGGYTYGFAWGDYDEDGDMDLFCARTFNENEASALFRNDGNANHWMTIDCKGTVSNRSAIGARIRVKAQINGLPVWQLRVIEGQQGYCGQTLQQHFGLELASVIDSLIIDWPSGLQDRFANVPVNHHYAIAENQTVIPEPSSPPDGADSQLLVTTVRWHRTLLGAPFHLQVSTDSTFGAGMIVDDSTITDTSRTLDSLANTSRFFWRVQQSRSIRKDLWSAVRQFVVGATLFGYDIRAQWNLVSVPVTVADYALAHLFDNAVTPAYSYGASSYAARETLTNGPGYWVKASSNRNFQISGISRPPESLAVASGWNLVGSRASRIPAAAVTSIPAGILVSSFFGYERGYARADSLAPFRGYWVFANAPGTVVLGDSVPGAVAAVRKTDAGAPTASAFRLLFQDGAGNAQALFLAPGASSDAMSRNIYALPPVPPRGGFDVRFTSGRYLEVAPLAGEGLFPIDVSSAVYPLILSLPDGLPAGAAFTAAGAVLDADNRGEIVLAGPVRGLSLRVARSTGGVPDRVTLAQNFPNPFNPETSIEYAIPGGTEGRVSLIVYDLLGREVETLVSASLSPGRYRASWNAASYPGGIYYCRLSAGGATETRKMVVMK